MRHILSTLFLLSVTVLTTNIAHSQILEPVKWQTSQQKISNTEYELTFKATIDKKWHLYAQYLPPENYSLPTKFEFDSINNVELIDTVLELSPVHEVYEQVAQAISRYFTDEAIFKQKIKITGQNPIVKGYIDYMVCDDGQCIKLDYEFTFYIGQQDTEAQITETETTSQQSNTSLWGIIIEAILWGFAALLTPCVFPMIPMTVSFFMKSSDNRAKGKILAGTYGVSIIALYTIPIAAIILITYIFGGESVTADIFNWLSTHWIPNILFFVIFMIFAASFLGAFEIVLPSSLVNKADNNANRGGIIGAFFMALTLVLVSFSCTGPIVGTIIVKSTQGHIWEPIVTMVAFSAAFALPFTLFALFPSWLNKLPKSGGWLNSVKVVLGFIEIALGLKFLSIADQTYHWGILDREVYLAIWIVTFTLLGLYLLGKIQFAHDSKPGHVTVPRLAMAIAVFAFVVYLIPGMWGAPLKALSGYLPPQTTLDFDMERMLRDNQTAFSTTTENQNANQNICEKPKYSDILHLPHGLTGYFDFEQGMACAKAQNKPVFIDFTGHGCVNCREMEARVWSDPRVLKILNNNYIIIALYIDDKTKLPENEWVTSTFDGKTKKTIGKKYADFQVSRFNINAQPYYVLLDNNNNILVSPKSYDLNVDNFIAFLNKGLEQYNNSSR